MNPKVPEMIIEHLRSAGYDIRTELGDSIIYQGDQSHLIYIQVRDGKKTYLPITLTPAMLTSVSKPEPELEQHTILSQETAVPTADEPIHQNVLTKEHIENSAMVSSDPVWDENITDLLAKINTTKESLRALIQS